MRKDLKNYIKIEVYGNKKQSVIKKIKLKYITPSTNFVYLARKMWVYHNCNNKIFKIISKIYYLRIYHKYGCCIFPSAKIDMGLKVPHPVGIVIGNCIAGKNLTILQGVTIGEKNIGESKEDNTKIPKIGNDVFIAANSSILGDTKITDNVIIGANSVVVKSIFQSGTYVGCPIEKIK